MASTHLLAGSAEVVFGQQNFLFRLNYTARSQCMFGWCRGMLSAQQVHILTSKSRVISRLPGEGSKFIRQAFKVTFKECVTTSLKANTFYK